MGYQPGVRLWLAYLRSLRIYKNCHIKAGRYRMDYLQICAICLPSCRLHWSTSKYEVKYEDSQFLFSCFLSQKLTILAASLQRHISKVYPFILNERVFVYDCLILTYYSSSFPICSYIESGMWPCLLLRHNNLKICETFCICYCEVRIAVINL
jgi:hypothetical protein